MGISSSPSVGLVESRQLASISFVIPAYDVDDRIRGAIESIHLPLRSGKVGFSVEVIVVDDGSANPEALAAAVAEFPGTILLRHETNRGMCAARNTGFQAATSEYVTILDADDRLAGDWHTSLVDVVAGWPPNTQVCLSACVDQFGETTVSEPHYEGFIDINDFLAERHRGEYMPIFEASYVQERGYQDLGIRRSCGTFSYIRFLCDGPFWITPKVVRIYTVERKGSVTQSWTLSKSAMESVRCNEAILDEFGDMLLKVNRRAYFRFHLKAAFYRHIANQPGRWKRWAAGVDTWTVPEALCVAVLLLFTPALAVNLVKMARKLHLLRPYG